MRKFISIGFIACIILAAWILYQKSIFQSSYNGLPTVPCIDTTEPITQSYTFHLTINVDNHPYQLDKNIGHDYGKCLHDIYVMDNSGTVFIKTNGNEKFTLGNFFDVWHKTFNKNQIFGHLVTNGHEIQIFVDGKKVETYDKAPILPNETIEIVYK